AGRKRLGVPPLPSLQPIPSLDPVPLDILVTEEATLRSRRRPRIWVVSIIVAALAVGLAIVARPLRSAKTPEVAQEHWAGFGLVEDDPRAEAPVRPDPARAPEPVISPDVEHEPTPVNAAAPAASNATTARPRDVRVPNWQAPAPQRPRTKKPGDQAEVYEAP